MFAWLTNRLRCSAGKLRVAVVTPVGPGHADLYAQCRASVEAAWRHGRGPFTALSFVAVDDGVGSLGRSRARNLGIDRAVQEGADWLFFLDADDLMVAGAFDAVAPFVGDHDAVWGLILGLSPDATRPHLRIPQIIMMQTLDDLLLFDPFLTLQMGHFVRAPVAQAVRFDEARDAGEDFDYYLRLWTDHRCAKVAREFFINRHARRSTGPRAASAEEWGAAVRGQQRAERERRGLAPDTGSAREIRNARAAELQSFCRQHALVSARDCVALSAQMPFHGTVEINEYEGGAFLLHTENDDAICAQLAWTGEYQPFAAALWQAIADGCGAIVDTGCGKGFYALLAARVAPQARIICFEAVAENLARARINAELNDARNIELIGPAPGRPVDFPRIDDGLSQAGIESVAVARIGAGSGAIDVLRGMAQTLSRHRPDLLIDLPDASSTAAVEEILLPHGYHCYAVDNAERTLSLCGVEPAPLADGTLQLLASARAQQEIRRITGAAMGRFIEE